MKAYLMIALSIISANLALPQVQEQDYPPLQQLISEKQFKKYTNEDSYKKRMDVYRDVFSSCASELRGRINEKQIHDIGEILLKMRAISHYALNDPTLSSASSKDLRSGQVKKLEIRLRKLLGTLKDLELAVPYDYRADFGATALEIDKLRDQLLKQLFGL